MWYLGDTEENKLYEVKVFRSMREFRNILFVEKYTENIHFFFQIEKLARGIILLYI